MQGLSNVLVGVIVPAVLFLGGLRRCVGRGQVFLQELDNVQVGRSDLTVVFFNVIVLLFVLDRAVPNLGILANFNLLDLALASLLHLSAQVLHPLLVLELNLVTDSFVITSDGAHLFVVGLVERV